MTSVIPLIGSQPTSNGCATSTRQSPTTLRIGPPDGEAWIRHYEWEGAELPERVLPAGIIAPLSIGNLRR